MFNGLTLYILPIANVTFAFRESTMAGKVIVLLLFVGSIFAWSIMVSKIRELSRAEKSSRHFLYSYRKESHPLNLFLRQKKFRGSPVYDIYEKGCNALGTEMEQDYNSSSLFGEPGEDLHSKLTGMQMELIRNLAERNVADQALLLENNMGYLATAVSASPFLGLLGTVWGVMDAFGGMAVTGAPTLAAVAPGISGALLTTVVALLVALPSAIGYNMLTNRIRQLCVEMDNFAQEFSADVQRSFGVE